MNRVHVALPADFRVAVVSSRDHICYEGVWSGQRRGASTAKSISSQGNSD